MRIATLIALLGLAAMSAVLIYGFSVGDFLGEGARLLAMPWGIVSMVDPCVGFILFSGWIVYREKSLARSMRSSPWSQVAATGSAFGWVGARHSLHLARVDTRVISSFKGGIDETKSGSHLAERHPCGWHHRHEHPGQRLAAQRAEYR